eukprot:Colp12_sorted_trinity150504_noHs@10419
MEGGTEEKKERSALETLVRKMSMTKKRKSQLMAQINAHDSGIVSEPATPSLEITCAEPEPEEKVERRKSRNSKSEESGKRKSGMFSRLFRKSAVLDEPPVSSESTTVVEHVQQKPGNQLAVEGQIEVKTELKSPSKISFKEQPVDIEKQQNEGSLSSLWGEIKGACKIEDSKPVTSEVENKDGSLSSLWGEISKSVITEVKEEVKAEPK